ncbi:unnamed protein product [Ilex paraguariensis]|uniref:Uncharacterized protein n=1 Tax=Ilex paraguariensis TaxID=185542 RepID=A0ABC8RY96_9AQUA
MEEPNKTAEAMPQNPPPQDPDSNKRLLDKVSHFQNSSYYKMRAVVKDLRPHFIEVLRAPDFQNCNAASEIKEKTKFLMDLYKEMTAEPVTIEKCKNAPEGQPLSGEIEDGQKPGEQHQHVKSIDQPPSVRVDKPVLSTNIAKKQRCEDVRMQGTYIVGGSAFGWNFITYPGTKAVYYCRTKESFRSPNVIPLESVV